MKNISLIAKTLNNKDKESQCIFTEWVNEAGAKLEFKDAIAVEKAIDMVKKSTDPIIKEFERRKFK